MADFSKQYLNKEEIVRQIVEHVERLNAGHVVMEGVSLCGRTGFIILLPVELRQDVVEGAMQGMADGIDSLLQEVKRRPDLRVDRPRQS